MKKISLLIIFLFFTTSSFSQLTFEKGYVIKNSGEKINCFIKKIDLEYNPTEITYKISKNSTPQIATLNDTKEISLQNVKYIRRTLNIDKSSDITGYLSSERNPTFKKETLFLKTLTEGNANLYHYKQNNLERFFYNINDNEITQLVYKSYLRNNIKLQNNYYRQQLFTKLKCSSLITTDKLQKLSYTESDLTSFFKKYNDCYYGTNVKEKNRNLLSLTFRPRLNQSSLTIENPESELFEFNDLGKQINYGFGIEMEYIVSPKKRDWAIIIEPTYQNFKAEKRTNSDFISGGVLITNVDYNTIDIPVGIRYYFLPDKKLRIFTNISYTFGITFNSSIEFKREDNSSASSIDLDTNNNFALGIGISFNKKLNFELRQMTKRNIIAFNSWESEYKSFSFVFGYTL